MPVPESDLTEVKPAGAFVATTPRGIPAYLFCSSRGPTTPQTFGAKRHKDIAARYGCGGVRRAAYMAQQSAAECVCVRVPATQRAASKGPATVSRNVSSDFTYTLSGTPTDGADVVIAVTTGGTTGGAGAAYKVSLDGGDTFGAVTPLSTATSITVLGVAVALGSSKTLTAGDRILWFQRAASASILPAVVKRAASSTFTSTPTGAPEDTYRVRVEFLTGGTLGTAGITYRACLDWDGVTGKWTPETQLGTATSIALYDDTEATGITVPLSTSGSTVDAGDAIEFNTTAPEAAAADVAAALTALRASRLTWSFAAVCSPMSAADCTTLDTLLVGWASSYRRWCIPETRDRETYETIAAHAARVRADFLGFTSTRVFPAAGHAPAVDPITFARPRWSASIDYLVRFTTVPQISTDAAQVTLGALPASRALYRDGVQTEYDAAAAPALFDAQGDGRGFLVLRTWEDANLPGTYPAGSICMPSAGDLGLVQLRRVLDAFEDALQSQARIELVAKFRRWTPAQVAKSSQYKAGDIYEADARAIEARLRKAGRNAVQDTGDASGITVTLNRTPVALGGGKLALSYGGQCAPLGYVYKFTGEVGLVDEGT
jgi:hypothetical protein